MTTRTLSLSLLLLGGGFCSVAPARPQSTQTRAQVCKPKPASAALKNYIDQTDVATQNFVIGLSHELESVENHLRPQPGGPGPAQSGETENASDAAMANDPQMLEVIDKLRTATRPFRNFNPVPRSAAKIDAKFVEFSLKMEHGLDLLQISLATPDDQELEDKAFKQLDEAMDLLTQVAEEILALKQSLQTQAVHKTYVRG